MSSSTFDHRHAISFGDCDPAGILFYPNHFRFMDATFQAFLRARGTSQAAVQARFEAVGTGLVEASGSFRGPVHDGNTLHHALDLAEWTARTFRLRYVACVDGRTVFEGEEVRGLFVRRDGRLRLSELDDLRALLEG